MSHCARGQVGGEQVDQGGGAVEEQALQALSDNKGKTVFDINHYKTIFLRNAHLRDERKLRKGSK